MDFRAISAIATGLLLTGAPAAGQDVPFGLAGVKVPVTDIERAADFYQRHAGYRKGPRYAPYELVLLPAEGSGASIVMYDITKAPEPERPVRSFILIRVAELDATVRGLRDQKLPDVGEVIRTPVADLAIAHDPDGNIVEFIQIKQP